MTCARPVERETPLEDESLDEDSELSESVVGLSEAGGSATRGGVADVADSEFVVATWAMVVPLPSNVTAARAPKPAEAANPAIVVPTVRFRRRVVARDRVTRLRGVEVFMAAMVAPRTFRIDDGT